MAFIVKGTNIVGGGGEQVANRHNYSTDEHIIGTWIDGKPIYEYTAHKTVNSTQDSLPAPSNIDKLIDLEGFVIRPNGNMTKLNTYVSSTDDSHFYYSSSTGNIELRAGSSYGKGEWYITPRYTKTTD